MCVECGDETFDPFWSNGEQDVYMGSRDLAETRMLVVVRRARLPAAKRKAAL